MALSSDKKLYGAVGILVVLIGALYLQNQAKKEDVRAHTIEGLTDSLPRLELSEETAQKLTKLVLSQPEKKGDSPKPATEHVLVRDGEAWKLEAPVKAAANVSNVDSLLKNLPKLTIKERIAKGADSYAQYDLTDETAVRLQAYEGDKVVLELWFGKSGGRGQMVRVKDSEGVYVLDGYSSFLYTRDTKGWRDLGIFTFEAEKATRVDIENEKGSFAFKKEGGEWKSEFKKAKSPVGAKIKDFDGSKVEDLLRAYKSLNASDFGDAKTSEETGLTTPSAKLIVSLEDGQKREIWFGSTAEGSNRWAKLPEGAQIYSLSSWSSDWAFAEETKFQKKADEPAEEAPVGLPGFEHAPH